MIDVVDDDGWRGAGDVAEFERHAFVGVVLLLPANPRIPVADQVFSQVDDARSGEAGQANLTAPVWQRLAGVGVQRDEEEPRRCDEDDTLAVDLRVRHALSVGGAHRILRAIGLGLDPIPEQLAAGRIDRHHVPPRPGDAQQLPADVTWSGAGRHGADDVDGAEFPGLLQRFEIGRRDLIERRVSGMTDVTAQSPPLAVLRAAPSRLGGRYRKSHGRQKADGKHRNNHRVFAHDGRLSRGGRAVN